MAICCIGVNSIPHINNPVCFAVFPETESKQVIQGTFRAAQSAVFMLMKQYVVCSRPGCEACACVGELMQMDFVKQFMAKPAITAEQLEVDETLFDCSLGWSSFTEEIQEKFGIEANMCTNHTTGIPAANYSQAKYYRTREIYDQVCDLMVRRSARPTSVWVHCRQGAHRHDSLFS